MGVKLTSVKDTSYGTINGFYALDEYRQKLHEIGKCHIERLTIPLFLSKFLYFTFGRGKLERMAVDQAHSFTSSVIASRRKTFIQQNNDDTISKAPDVSSTKKRQAMLDTLLEAEQNHQSIDSAGIQEEVETFVFF